MCCTLVRCIISHLDTMHSVALVCEGSERKRGKEKTKHWKVIQQNTYITTANHQPLALHPLVGRSGARSRSRSPLPLHSPSTKSNDPQLKLYKKSWAYVIGMSVATSKCRLQSKVRKQSLSAIDRHAERLLGQLLSNLPQHPHISRHVSYPRREIYTGVTPFMSYI